MPVTAQTPPGFLSAPCAVYAPLLTPQKYARESGKTYGHRRLVFSLLAAGYEVILAAELFSTVVPNNYNTRLPYKELPWIMGC